VRAKQWLEENKAAFEYCNKYVEDHGLTVDRFDVYGLPASGTRLYFVAVQSEFVGHLPTSMVIS
jgi:hypothetical protein